MKSNEHVLTIERQFVFDKISISDKIVMMIPIFHIFPIIHFKYAEIDILFVVLVENKLTNYDQMA